MALKFSMILEAVDRYTRPAKNATGAMGGMARMAQKVTAQAKKQATAIKSGTRSVEHYERRARRLRRVALGSFFKAGARSAKKMGDKVDRLAGKLRLAERAGKGAKKGLKWMGGKAAGLAKWGLAAGAAAGGFALFDMFKDAGRAEQAQSELSAFLGSAERARREMAQLKASDFGVPIGQLLAGYVELRKAGIEPTDASLRTMADEARKSKTQFADIVSIMSEVRGGDFGNLESIGINVSKSKGVVGLTYLDKTGKRVSRSVQDSADDIEDALMQIFDARSGGAASRYQRTMFGLIDGIRNRWNRFQLMVADAGIFDAVKSKLDEWQGKLDVMAKDGRLKRWAEQISDKLESAFDWAMKFAESVDWNAVAKGLAAGVELLVKAVELLGKAAEIANDISTNGVVKVKSKSTIKTKDTPWYKGIWDVKSKPAAPAKKPRKPGRAQAYRTGRNNPALASATVGGEIKLAVNVKGPATAKVERARSSNRNVPIRTSIGRTMDMAA